jgi:glycolate oxidase FAD binding subunit
MTTPGLPEEPGVKASAVAEPASIEQALVRLRDAADSGAAILPWGGGCFIELAGPVRQADLLLKMQGINQAVFYEPEELVVRVEAGMTLASLNSLLAEKGQEVPWDFPWPERQTVGGILASGLAGPRRTGAGSPRNHLLGVTLALTDGRVLRTGSRVMKNVAGYDLTRLVAGSFGSLGVILEAAIRVRPVPEDMWSASARFASGPAVAGSVLELGRSNLALAFLELRGNPGDYVLSAGVEGMREDVEAQRLAVLAILARGGKVEGEYRGAAARARLDGLAGEPWKSSGPKFRVSFPPDRLAGVLQAAREQVFSPVLGGVARLVPGRDLTMMEVRERVEELAAVVGPLGGWVVPECSKVGQEEFMPAPIRRLNQGIRRIFDGAGCMSAGRSVPGA